MEQQLKELQKEDLYTLVEEYMRLTETIKLLTKKQTAQKEKIKSLMEELKTDRVYIPEVGTASLQKIDTSTLNLERVLTYFKTKEEYFKFIHTKEYLDEDEIATAVKDGQLNPEELTNYIENSQIVRLRTYKSKHTKELIDEPGWNK